MIREHTSNSTVVHRLEQLIELYQQDQASEMMLHTLDKLFLYEADICRKQLRELHNDLADYEKRYGMSSARFYELFQQGQTDDRMDYVEWASLFQMAQRLEKRLALLTSGENL